MSDNEIEIKVTVGEFEVRVKSNGRSLKELTDFCAVTDLRADSPTYGKPLTIAEIAKRDALIMNQYDQLTPECAEKVAKMMVGKPVVDRRPGATYGQELGKVISAEAKDGTRFSTNTPLSCLGDSLNVSFLAAAPPKPISLKKLRKNYRQLLRELWDSTK
jgi:hypothetical protein